MLESQLVQEDAGLAQTRESGGKDSSTLGTWGQTPSTGRHSRV